MGRLIAQTLCAASVTNGVLFADNAPIKRSRGKLDYRTWRPGHVLGKQSRGGPVLSWIQIPVRHSMNRLSTNGTAPNLATPRNPPRALNNTTTTPLLPRPATPARSAARKSRRGTGYGG